MQRFYPTTYKLLVSLLPALLIFLYYYSTNYADSTCIGSGFIPHSHYSPVTHKCQLYTLQSFVMEYARYILIPFIITYIGASLIKEKNEQRKGITYVFTIIAILVISLYAAIFTFVPVATLLQIPPNSLGFFFPGIGTIILIASLMVIYSVILTTIAYRLYLHKFN